MGGMFSLTYHLMGGLFMSNNLNKATGEFREWVRKMRGRPARSASNEDPLAVEKVTVLAHEAVDRFVKLHPEWNDFRDEIDGRETYRFVKSLWS